MEVTDIFPIEATRTAIDYWYGVIPYHIRVQNGTVIYMMTGAKICIATRLEKRLTCEFLTGTKCKETKTLTAAYAGTRTITGKTKSNNTRDDHPRRNKESSPTLVTPNKNLHINKNINKYTRQTYNNTSLIFQ